MTQIGRPRGLIDYVTEESAELEKTGQPPKPVVRTLLRPRTIAYFMLWGSIGLAMLFVLGQRTRIDISALQDRNPQFVRLSDGHIRNSYTIKVRNMENRPRTVEIGIDGLPDAIMWTAEGTRDTGGRTVKIETPADAVAKTRIFVATPAEGEPRQEIFFTVRGLDATGGTDRDNVYFDREVAK